MKINYLYEAGAFGSYKNRSKESIANSTRRELAGIALDAAVEAHIDELAELYLDMLNEVNLQIGSISNKYNPDNSIEHPSNLVELTNYVVNINRYTMSIIKTSRREAQLTLIKNMYCNKPAIDYMISKGCFILPLIDIKRNWVFFRGSREIIPYKNMIKTVADAAEKMIKMHLSKFPNYVSNIIPPNKVKIVIVNSSFGTIYQSWQDQQLFSYMGITSNGVEFKYPGHGSSCLNYILDNYTSLLSSCTIQPDKSDESIWKTLADPSPWMFNKIVFRGITTYMSTLSADNFYGVKLLKFALDNNIISNKDYSPISIVIDNVLKNIQSISKLKQEISNNGLDGYVEYSFNNIVNYVESFICIGKEITSKQAEQEGIFIDSLKRRVYEFDYNDTAEVKSAAKDIINGCSKFLTDAKIKKMAEDKMEEYLPSLMAKVLASRPNCVGSSNKILLCDYHQKDASEKNNIRVVIDANKIEINKKGNLVFYIAIDFKLPVRGVNTKYNSRVTGKNYDYITGKKINIEIPL